MCDRLAEILRLDEEITRLEATLEELKARRAAATRTALADGITQYRIAQAVERTQSTVARWKKM
ncbi:hypothetical protein GWO63_010310 [Corynebacterium macginleyi]|uniref:Helix-turn-helix domain-containing protein n=1 Tax=Corynebacterium macginleyi TaxID=38290 RepID=A0ABS1Y8M3_9CORY|nr:hypothetical protein [Corynebacterium macginleyi]MBK4141164.1 hypothetical protein [Corynebacterium macginleyi]MBK4146609.1 hypothetical protein [Corynebacterium macginleyi]MBK4179790.1 hypothetical protein [Corynebacterium macginleyi]MBM0244621.1 hypothetical protein [Corynebacterium macginleyi]